jgi:hypothetical protein
MQIGGTGIAPRPRASLQQGDEVGDMIGMKMRHHDMIEPIMRNANLKQALHNAMPAIKEDWQAIQLQQYARSAPLMLNLAGTRAE